MGWHFPTLFQILQDSLFHSLKSKVPPPFFIIYGTHIALISFDFSLDSLHLLIRTKKNQQILHAYDMPATYLCSVGYERKYTCGSWGRP